MKFWMKHDAPDRTDARWSERVGRIVHSTSDGVKVCESPIGDAEFEHYPVQRLTMLTAATNPYSASADSDFTVLTIPRDHSSATNFFDTESVKTTIGRVVPINSTAEISPRETVSLSPEVLREGRVFYDNLHRSRIVVADQTETGHQSADRLPEGALGGDVPPLLTDPTEAGSNQALRQRATRVTCPNRRGS